MKLYKLTDENGFTKNNVKWYEGFTLTLPRKKNPQLCTADLVHAYKNINLGLLLNPIHANIINPLLWEAKGEVVVEDYGKVGCFELTTKKQIPLPEWHINENKRKDVIILFAILCAEAVLSVYENKYPTDDRPRKAIEAAREYLKIKTADAAFAAYAAAFAAFAAYAAAFAAADAAANATYAAIDTEIDFCKLADEAVKQIMEDQFYREVIR